MEHVGDASVRSDMGYVSTVSRYRAQDCTGCSLRGMCHKEARDQRVIDVNHQGNAYRAEAKALLSERSERSPFRGNHMPLKNSAHKKNKRGRHFGSASLRFVGVTGFEPATTRPPDVYSNRTELRPDCPSKAVAKLVLLTLFANKSHFFFMPNGVFFCCIRKAPVCQPNMMAAMPRLTLTKIICDMSSMTKSPTSLCLRMLSGLVQKPSEAKAKLNMV